MNLMLAFSDPLKHVLSHPLVTLENGTVVLDNHIVMEVVATVLMLVLIISAFRSRANAGDSDVEAMVPKGSANFFEAICNYLRN